MTTTAVAAPADRRCGAKTRAGGHCVNRPLTGATRCRMHGAATKAAKAKAARDVARAAAERLAVTYGLPVEIDPTDALLAERARANGVVLWLEQQVRGLTADEVTWGLLEQVVEEKRATEFAGTDTSTKHGAAVHALVQLYGVERDRLVKVAAECRKAGVEQAVADRVKALAAEFTAKLAGVLRALGHNPNDPATLRTVAEALRGPAILEGGTGR